MAKTLFDIREETELMEKLRAADPTGKWVSDFVHSDNPKFAGKSKKERIRMALGAAYGAKQQNEDVEQTDEAAWGKDKMANLKAAHDRHSEKAIAANKAGDHDAVKVHQSKMNMIKTQMNRLRTEEVELDEAIKLGSKVVIHAPGKSYHGKTGHVGEIRNGAFKGAPKTYTVDHDGGSTQIGQKNVKLHIEEVELDEAGGMKSAALVKAMMKKQKQTAAMTPKKQEKQRQHYQDKKQQNEMSNVVFDNSGNSQGVTAGSIKSAAALRPAHLIKPEKDAISRARSLKHKEKKMKTEAKSLYDRHQELRKKSGLPDPSHYLKLAKQKQAEIDAMKADQGSTERLHTLAPEPHPGAQKSFTGLRNKK